MTTARIDFANRFRSPENLAIVILVAGVPIVLGPSGLRITETAVTSGTVDPLWWPGVGSLLYNLPAEAGIDPYRDWLDPASVFEIYRKSDILKGDVRAEPMSFDLYDPQGAATAILSAPRARVAQLLTASITPTDTLIPVDSLASVPASGLAWIGRECVIYDSAALGSLGIASPPATRGAFGSRPRGHTVDVTKPPLVTFGAWPRYWYGRTTSVWLCRMVGTVATDPSLIFLGTVGPGVQRAKNGTRISIPVDCVTETLTRKLARRTLTLFGISHLDTNRGPRAPLQAGLRTYLGNDGPFDRDGWHPDFASFVADFNDAAATTYADNVTASITGDKLAVHQWGLGSEQGVGITVAWDTNPAPDVRADTSGVMDWSSQRAAPDTCVHLSGKVPLPFPGDVAKIPAGLVVGFARYTLTAEKTANSDEPLSAVIIATGANGALDWVAVDALVPATLNDADLSRRALITERTSVQLGVIASAPYPTSALRSASDALDQLDGGLHEEAIDWDQIERLFYATPLGTIPGARAYTFGDGDTILNALSHELRLRGMALCTRYGRLAAFRTAVFASTEETSAVITEDDVLTDGEGLPLEPEVIDAESPAATSILFKLPGGASYQWVDDTGRGEFGDGAEVECRALEWVPPGTDLSSIAAAIQQTAQQVLGALAEPYRTVRVTLGPRYLGLQEGDLALFSHKRVPTLTGTIGVVEQTCQIEEVRMQVMGGRGRVVAALRLQEPDLAGYAPEVLVAAGGLSAASAVVTVDTGSGFGPTCFARATRPDGTASTNALDGLVVGDHVVLSQLARTPIADEPFTITALDPVAGTVTLSAAPSAPMAAAAAGQYGVILRFADWTVVDAASPTVRDRQERFLYIADHAAQDLGAGDAPKRWAA